MCICVRVCNSVRRGSPVAVHPRNGRTQPDDERIPSFYYSRLGLCQACADFSQNRFNRIQALGTFRVVI